MACQLMVRQLKAIESKVCSLLFSTNVINYEYYLINYIAYDTIDYFCIANDIK